MVAINVLGSLFPRYRRLPLCDLQERLLSEKKRLSKETLAQYRWMFDKLAGYTAYWPSTASEINGFIGSLDGVNDVTVHQLFKCLRMVGRYAKRTYGLPDPTEDADSPPVKRKNRRYFTTKELSSIIGACRSTREKLLVLVSLDSSARIGELARLRVEDLGDDFIDVSGKTGERRYRCDPRLIAMMRETAVEGYVFPMKQSGSGDRVAIPARCGNSDGLSAEVRRIMKRAGLTGSKLGPHTLRHTAASLVASGTGSALSVKALLQHDSISTSMVYIHDAEGLLQRKISPLALAGISLGSAYSLPAHHGDEEDSVTDTSEQLAGVFPVIPDGVSIRPCLNCDDLNLIRDGLIELMRVCGEPGIGSPGAQLMLRMMRRVKRSQGRSVAKPVGVP